MDQQSKRQDKKNSEKKNKEYSIYSSKHIRITEEKRKSDKDKK